MTRIRLWWQVFFISLFVFLIFITTFGYLKGYPARLLLDTDYLNGLANAIANHEVYRGLILGLLVFVPTVLVGRFYCNWVCPLGILHHFFGWIFNPRKTKERIDSNRFRPIFRLKYYVLLAILLGAALGSLQSGLMDPIPLITRSFANGVMQTSRGLAGEPVIPGMPAKQIYAHWGWIISGLFVLILWANRVVPRFWCRALCPFGALMGLTSKWSLWQINRDPAKCTDCDLCLRECQGASDPHAKLRKSECFVCLNCRDLCPHDAITFSFMPAVNRSLKAPDLDRRRVLGAAAAGVLFVPFARYGQRVAVDKEKVVRPPGSVAEEEFLKRCIKCAECMKVCPTNVLQPAFLEAGIEGLWTPIQVNRQTPEGVEGVGFCQPDCVLCGQVCPTGAIQPLAVEQRKGQGLPPYDKPVKTGTAFYDIGRCLPHAMNTPCVVCEEVCPTTPKAIWSERVKKITRNLDPATGEPQVIELQVPHVTVDLCIGCGLCENKCPIEDSPAIYVTSYGESREKKFRTGFMKRA